MQGRIFALSGYGSPNFGVQCIAKPGPRYGTRRATIVIYTQLQIGRMALPRSATEMSDAAMGRIHADTVIRGCSLVSVYTGEIIPDTQISVYRSRISYVGPDASHTVGPGTKVIDAKGRHVVPGLADPHIHIDQFVLPAVTARSLLMHGTTTLFSDPIDITGVAGYRGFAWFKEACGDLPVRIFQGIPGGQPVDPEFSYAHSLSAAEQDALLEDPAVFGMGEIFAWTKVTGCHYPTMEAIDRTVRAGAVVNGHTAGMRGTKLAAYAASGIMSCHEPIDFDQVLERLRLGMYVMIREGSIRRDLRRIVERVVSEDTYTSRLMFCSDGLNPADMGSGHIDHCVREAIRAGIGPVEAVSMATRNVSVYYGMDSDLGGIAPGRLADIIILDDLESFRINTVLTGGRVSVSGGALPADTSPRRETPAWLGDTVMVDRLAPGDFGVRAAGDTATANTICLRTEIVTAPGSAELQVRDSLVAVPEDGSIWKVAAIDRVTGSGRRAVGFLEGFGKGDGAVATTYTFHENDLVVIGTNDQDMAVAANRVISMHGGMAVARSSEVISELPLPVAGLMSEGPLEVVREGFEAVNGATIDIGCRFENPNLIPLFLPFLALPQVRILSSGIINVREGRVVPPIAAAD